jgi:transcriptional/translational regulatory protein YebC/TACO1
MLRIIEALEESDDVQNVYTNLKITEEVLAELEKE